MKKYWLPWNSANLRKIQLFYFRNCSDICIAWYHGTCNDSQYCLTSGHCMQESQHPQTFSKRKTNAIKCLLVLLCKAEDFHLECCSTVPLKALEFFRMSCSLFSNKWILMLTKVYVLLHSCCMLSVGVAMPNTSAYTEFISAVTN